MNKDEIITPHGVCTECGYDFFKPLKVANPCIVRCPCGHKCKVHAEIIYVENTNE